MKKAELLSADSAPARYKPSPTETELATLTDTHFIKVASFGEFFWCKVFKNDTEKKVITAIVDNDLVYSDEHGYYSDEFIEVPYKCVITILV